jgi:drug/metabolite transporter (DMT)-like permease
LKAFAALALIALVWGYNWVVMKEAMRYAGPFEFLGWRFALAGLLLLVMLAAMKRPLRLPHPRDVFLIGVFQTAFNFGLTTWALYYGAAGKSAVLTYTMPFWVVLLAWPLLRERPAPLQWGAIALGFAGIALLLGSGDAVAAGWLAIGAGVTWSIGVVIAKRLQMRENVDAISVSAWQALIGGAILIVMALLFPGKPTEWSAYLVFALAYNAVLVSALCWALWFWVLSRLTAGMASLGILAVPVVGTLAGVVELGERPSAPEWAGMALVIVALAIVARVAGRPARLPAAGPQSGPP